MKSGKAITNSVNANGVEGTKVATDSTTSSATPATGAAPAPPPLDSSAALKGVAADEHDTEGIPGKNSKVESADLAVAMETDDGSVSIHNSNSVQIWM